MPKKRLRWLVGRTLDARAWHPVRAQLLWRQVSGREHPQRIRSDEEHIRAAARWLARAQDVMDDGGVAGRFLLDGGWTSSYPETSGYLVPTLLELVQETGEESFRDRASRCVDFLLGVQLDNGAFPGGEVHESAEEPSVFNTAQILAGLTAWDRAADDRQVRDAAVRAADWLITTQENDGSWRRYVYMDTPVTYMAHAGCWLAEFGAHSGQDRYLRAADRHLDWVLSHRDPTTGWFDRCGFGKAEHDQRTAFTHTIGYTLFGVLRLSEILGRADGLEALEAGAVATARRLELSRWLPGILDHRWAGRADYACLTGNAQMAQFWMCLYRHTGDDRLVSAAFKSLDLVKAAQVLDTGKPDLDGAVPGSDPIWGGYIYNGLPNWAPKFFIDALLEKQRVLKVLEARPSAGWNPPSDVPRKFPQTEEPSGNESTSASARVVLLTRPGSHKVAQMLSEWAKWGFEPHAVIVERAQTRESLTERVGTRIRRDGLSGLIRAALRRFARPGPSSPGPPAMGPSFSADPVSYCRERSIPVIDVPALESPEGVRAIEKVAPDLAVHAGAGILRQAFLDIPRLGTINAHMGLLPYYRGMNVTEWAAFRRDPVGCSVQVIDPGIDTGDILVVRPLDYRDVSSIAELRALVDREQIRLLGEVVQFVERTGSLPPRRSQEADEGIQFFRMHSELGDILENRFKSPGDID